jgi:hypothetical protein
VSNYIIVKVHALRNGDRKLGILSTGNNGHVTLITQHAGHKNRSSTKHTIPFIAHHTHSSRPPFSPPASTTAALARTTAAEYALSITIAFPF